jgi:hypothetical protein
MTGQTVQRALLVVQLELDLAHPPRVLAASLHEVLDLDLLERSPAVPIQSLQILVRIGLQLLEQVIAQIGKRQALRARLRRCRP